MFDSIKQVFTKYLLFTSLYFTEGIQLALTTVIIPIYLLELDYSPAIVTIAAAIAMLPWALKFFFGGIINSKQTINLKTYTLLGGIIASLSLILLYIINPSTQLTLFILILIIAQCGIGFLDVSTDAWAIDVTDKKERGKINGFMMAGLFGGIAIGAATLSTLAKNTTYPTTFLIAGCINLTLLLIPLFTKKPTDIKRKKPLFNLIKKEFSKRKTQALTLLLPLLSINSGIITIAIPLFMSLRLELNIAQIGLITTVFTISRVIGSISCGTLSDSHGRQKTLLTIVLLSIISTFTLFLTSTWEHLIIIYAVLGFLNGGLFSVLLATSMDITNLQISALQFSILISVMNSGELIGEFISGPIISLAGFNTLFLFATWILGPGLLLLYLTIKTNIISQ